MRLLVLSLLMLGGTIPALSQEPAPRRWIHGSGGVAIPDGSAEYAMGPLLHAQMGFGARIARIPTQVELLRADGGDTPYACFEPLLLPPCYRPLRRLHGLAISAAPVPGTAYPRTRLGVLVGVGAYRLPAGGDINGTTFPASTAFGVHAAVERQWYLRPKLGVTVALRPTVIPNVHGRALWLWPLAAGIRAW